MELTRPKTWLRLVFRVSISVLGVYLACLVIEVLGEVAKLPLGLYVFGTLGNIATFFGAFAECIRV